MTQSRSSKRKKQSRKGKISTSDKLKSMNEDIFNTRSKKDQLKNKDQIPSIIMFSITRKICGQSRLKNKNKKGNNRRKTRKIIGGGSLRRGKNMDSWSRIFLFQNRSKKEIASNLKKDKTLQLLIQLCFLKFPKAKKESPTANK